MVFIGLNDAQNEGDLQWANGEILTIDLSYNNSDVSDYAVMNFWAGTWEMYNYWVAKKYVMEINCTSPINHDFISHKSNNQLIDLYPNPANQLITAYLWADTHQDIKLSIFNLQGQWQSTKSTTLKTGNNHIVLNINDLENGMYFLKLTNNEMDKVIRFIKME